MNNGGFQPIPDRPSRGAAIVAVLSRPKHTGKGDVSYSTHARTHALPLHRPVPLLARPCRFERQRGASPSGRFYYMPMRPAPLLVHVDVGGQPVQGSPYVPLSLIANRRSKSACLALLAASAWFVR
jgi:hypothetical protein